MMKPIFITCLFSLLVSCNSSPENDPAILSKFINNKWQLVETINPKGIKFLARHKTIIIFDPNGYVKGGNEYPPKTRDTVINGVNTSIMSTNSFWTFGYKIFKNGKLELNQPLEYNESINIDYSKFLFLENGYLQLTGEGKDGTFVTTYKPIDNQSSDNSTSKKHQTNNQVTEENTISCNTELRIVGTLKELPQAGLEGFFMKIISDDKQEILIYYEGNGLQGEKIIIKKETTPFAGDAIFNTKLLNSRFVFCCNKTPENSAMGDKGMVLVNMTSIK